ncbi:hypothetical protein XELAEV_18001689mg [Xenopus laevis]|uniref:Uncharacterized protein n=1 Tax=Xenopus laevis TaxID=8355 RepID=A0A974GYG7_XENLA|nr:hypothetical protein XELAEV_18001689mg [Xenopus laevis]
MVLNCDERLGADLFVKPTDKNTLHLNHSLLSPLRNHYQNQNVSVLNGLQQIVKEWVKFFQRGYPMPLLQRQHEKVDGDQKNVITVVKTKENSLYFQMYIPK